MIVFTSVLLSLSSGQGDLTYQPLTKPSEGEYQNESYFGREDNPYNEDYILLPNPPPSPLVETVPVAPDPSYVWIAGYWRWADDHWRWVSGEWVKPPYEGAKWQAGYWEKRPEGWFWRKGRWKEQ